MSCLWACHTCEAIGEEADAERHMEAMGHAIEQLTDEASDGVRAKWAEERRERLVGLMMLGALSREA